MKIQTHITIPPHPIIFLFLSVFILLGGAVTASAAPYRVAILPFDIHAEQDLTFLQEGIMDMLASRLAWQDKVEVINETETRAAMASVEGFEGESQALLVGGKLQADYVLFGSLTVFDGCVSIDGKIADVSGQQRPLPFFARTTSMGEVIPKINEFATGINTRIFGRPLDHAPSAEKQNPQAGKPAYDPRIHPEKLLEPGIQ